MPTDIVQALLNSSEPSIRYLTATRVLDKSPSSKAMKDAQAEIKSSPRVQQLLSERKRGGEIPAHPYHKWTGAHWVLAALADLGYPSGEKGLIPLREQVYEWLFSEDVIDYIPLRTVLGRVRMHTSVDGNAIYYPIRLGLADERVEQLMERILSWRWPDGGWNCDMKKEASISSFMETLIPLRALVAYRHWSGDKKVERIIEEVAEVFLKRKLFKRLHGGAVMDSHFVKLHYPCYWHYDILFGLKVMAEADLIADKRCADALDLLESKRLPDGGFPAEAKYYQFRPVGERANAGRSRVDWGGTSKNRTNEFVTADALYVLKAAGRL